MRSSTHRHRKGLPWIWKLIISTGSMLGEYPAYQLGRSWQSEGQSKVTAQKTVVIPGSDGLYVLQLNADGLEDQSDIISAATDVIDNQTTNSF